MKAHSFNLSAGLVARSTLVLALSSAAVAACGNEPGPGVGPSAPQGSAGESSSAAGASSHEPEPDETGEAGAGGGSGTEVVEPPSDCEPTSKHDEPDEDTVDANCDGIDGDVKGGVFVATTGFDDAEGSIKRPVQSLAKAVELAADGDRPVYVCKGTYRENLLIETPVSIYGGYDCTRGWRRTKDWAVLQAGAGIPLAIKKVEGKVYLERLSFRAPDGLGAGQSSQAGAIVDSSDVTLAQVEMKAGRAGAGAAGISGRNASQISPRTSAPGNRGATVDCETPESPGGLPDFPCDRYAAGGFAAATTLACGNMVMRGGAGGVGGNVWLANNKPACFIRGFDEGEPGLAGQFHTGDGKWKDFAFADLGMNGADGTDGTGASLGVGSIDEGVYAATNAGADGEVAQPGFPGRGGAGGYSAGHAGDICGTDYRTGSGGGQGGLGGCGGGNGTAGGAGGGAVGLVIVNSSVKIAFARFVIGDGGDGGKGSEGGIGQSGGSEGLAGDAYANTYRGKAGQPGGRGGAGGDGGPGGGGPSIAVLVSGATPELSEAVYELGSPGVGGEAFSGPNGANGVTGEVVSLDEILGKKP